MAGTPTTNYNIPTYADTDAPDLSGAYNDAMNIIDTQMKANADAIESASTGNYTGTAPIMVDNEKRTIGIQYANVNENGAPVTRGAVDVTGVSNNITSSSALNGTKVPNLRAVADYVAAHGGTTYTAGEGITISGSTISAKRSQGPAIDETEVTNPGAVGTVYRISTTESAAVGIIDNPENDWYAGELVSMVPSVGTVKSYVNNKMVAAGAAYTGTAPIVVDNGSHTISVGFGTNIDYADGAYTDGVPGVVCAMNSTATLNYLSTGELPSAGGALMASIAGLRQWILSRTRDASTSVKGLVQLTTSPASADSTMAVTGSGVVHLLSDRKTNATTNVTVDMLKNLYVDTSTGVVYYKAPTE